MTAPHSSVNRPVILIHGAGSTTETQWRKAGWIDDLEASGRVVIGLDLPGHGAARDLTDHDAVDLLTEEATKHGSVDAIGYSAGALALLIAAAEQPSLFHRIAVLGFGDRILTQSTYASDLQQAMLQVLRSAEEAKDDPMAALLFAVIAEAGNDRDAVAAYLAAEKRFPTLEDLSRITAATLAVDGSGDPAGPPELVARTIPNSDRLTIAGAGHFDITTNAECRTTVIT